MTETAPDEKFLYPKFARRLRELARLPDEAASLDAIIRELEAFTDCVGKMAVAGIKQAVLDVFKELEDESA